jgi:exosortase B
MNTDTASAAPLNQRFSAAAPWFVALAGWAVMYGPVYWWAANSIWQSEEHGHGPLILGVLVWLFWTQRNALVAAATQPSPALGWLLFLGGLLVFVLGRVFSISIFELGSQPLVAAGALLVMRGPAALRVAWFPILYMMFMIPLPGIFVDAVTGPLKQWVSVIVESLLYAAGYPISRTGVTMTIGQYQLLVADACSGLNSMFSLSALGTLFMFIMARKSVWHNAIMLVSILPIAFAANIVRVCILVLVTYHLGDEAGQGFLHGAAGMVLMLVALGCFFFLDVSLAKLVKAQPEREATRRIPSAGRADK